MSNLLDKKNIELINVFVFGEKIGVLGSDKNKGDSYFLFDKEFLNKGIYKNLFPFVLKRTDQVQVFKNQNNKTFKGLPSVFADSLPDDFGNAIFNKWLSYNNIKASDLTPVHQLAYLSNRGMGAIEYFPGKNLDYSEGINLQKITRILKNVIKNKKNVFEDSLNSNALLNIFKLGTSAGGARPKIIVSENKVTNKLIPGDVEFSENYYHYLVKLNIGEDTYNRERVEYGYSKLVKMAGIDMMPCDLTEGHFITQRFDRVGGKKRHILTATGISGLDYRNAEHSSYENLFEIANYINLPQNDIERLFRRMVFNYVFHNIDDHLKNHSFIYDEKKDCWGLSPAYDINYSLDALNKWVGAVHSLSLNGKRKGIELEDFLGLAKKYAIKKPLKIIEDVESVVFEWERIAYEIGVEDKVIDKISEDFKIYSEKKNRNRRNINKR